MRFPLAALFLVVAGFMFLAFFGVGSFLLSSMDDALDPSTVDAQFSYEVDIIIAAFGVIAAIMLVLAVVVFVMDSLSDEPEMYWRR